MGAALRQCACRLMALRCLACSCPAGSNSGMGGFEDHSCSLALTYHMAHMPDQLLQQQQQQPTPGRRGSAAAGASSSCSGSSSEHSEVWVELPGSGPVRVPPPPLSEAVSTASTSGGGGALSLDDPAAGAGAGGPAHMHTTPSGPALLHSHTFTLEFPDSAAQEEVAVRLLGPLAGQVGRPLALTWQVMRMAAATAADSSSDASGAAEQQPATEQDEEHGEEGEGQEVLFYELVASSSSSGSGAAAERGWDGGCLPSKGSVRLGRAAGCMATVEAVLTPLVAGRLLAPELRLRGIHKAAGEEARAGGGADGCGDIVVVGL